MPHVTRKAISLYARAVRDAGEVIMCLIPAAVLVPSGVPFDLIGSNEAVDLTATSTIPIYAKIKYKPLGDIKYDEGGKGIFRSVSIEAPASYAFVMQKCIGIKLEDGSILRKCSENLSETQSFYTMCCEGYVAVPQGI